MKKKKIEEEASTTRVGRRHRGTGPAGRVQHYSTEVREAGRIVIRHYEDKHGTWSKIRGVGTKDGKAIHHRFSSTTV